MMDLSTSLYSALSGLNASTEMINVSGNNIANVNTTGYKSQRVNFENQILQQLAAGCGPTSTSGGTNPSQIGLGVSTAGTSTNFNTGTLQTTGISSDLAINGNGFFVLNDDGLSEYTRDGTFKVDQNFNLVNSNGAFVQGYGIDNNFNVVTSSLTNLQIPIGAMTIAQATSNVQFSGNLNAGGAVATQGAVLNTQTLTTTGGGDANANTALDALFNSGSSAALFSDGDIITVSGATLGGATIPDKTFQVFAPGSTLPNPPTASNAAGTTVGDFMTFLQNVLGIDTNTSAGSPAGVAINSGVITVTGDTGTVNDLGLTDSDITVTSAGQTSTPLSITKAQSADGESVRTSIEVYDSLGNQVPVNVSAVLESKNTNGGTTWRFYEQSSATSSLNAALGNGTLTFDSNGQLTNVTNDTVNLNLAGTGATSPQPITLSFDASQGAISAYSGSSSQITELNQDGAGMGTLQSFSVGNDGIITGTFSNSLTRTLGQVVVATFSNPQGLVAQANNVYTENVNSGTPSISVAGTGAAGTIAGGTIELSNVDLSNEFINLISASTGFTASSRVLTTSDQMIQGLLSAIATA